MFDKIQKIGEIVAELSTKTVYGISLNNKKFVKLGDSDGDSILFTGLLSTVDPTIDNWALEGVLDSQGSNGMFYRSPARKETNNAGFEHYFSRDMSLGVLAAMTNIDFPQDAGERWLNYIHKSKKFWLPYYSFAPDSRSAITPNLWALMGRVWRYRGESETGQMVRFAGADGDIEVFSAQTCELGYQLHLKVVAAYIKWRISQSREYSQKVGLIAHERIKDNIFYELIAKRHVTEDMLDRYIELYKNLPQTFGHSWIWEKSNISAHLPTCCGWDMIFMGRLLALNFLEGFE